MISRFRIASQVAIECLEATTEEICSFQEAQHEQFIAHLQVFRLKENIWKSYIIEHRNWILIALNQILKKVEIN